MYNCRSYGRGCVINQCQLCTRELGNTVVGGAVNQYQWGATVSHTAEGVQSPRASGVGSRSYVGEGGMVMQSQFV